MEECYEALLAKWRAQCKQNPGKHTVHEACNLFRTMLSRHRAHATESLSGSVCVEERDRAWALMRGAGGKEHPSVRWSLGPVNVVEAKSDTTYTFFEKGTWCALSVAFMKSIPKCFLRTLLGGHRATYPT